MTGRLMSRALFRRPPWLLAGVVLLQLGFVLAALNVSMRDPFSILLAAVFAAPVFVLALLLYPSAGILSVPVLVIVPGWFLGFTLAEAVLLVAMFLAVLRLSASGVRFRGLRPAETIFLLYVVWAGMSVFQAVDIASALAGLKAIVMLSLAFVAGVRFVGAGRARTLVWCVALLGVLIGLQLTVAVFGRGYSFSVLLARVVTVTDLGWGFSNYVAAVAVLTTAASIPLAFHGRAWERLLGGAGLASAMFVSVATTSRGGTLALFVVLLAATAMEARRRFLVAAALLAVMASVYMLSPLGQASIDRFLEPKDLPSVAVRVAYYQETFRIAGDNLFLGVGPGQIPYHSSLFIDPNPHNFLLKNAAELGIPGLGLYLILLGLVAARGRRFHATRDRESRILGLSLVLVLVAGITNGLYEPTLGGWVYGAVFWMLVGGLYAAGETRSNPGKASP